MKKHLTAIVLLLTLAPLGACNSTDRPEWLGGEPKRPAADVKMGPRRAPVLQDMPMTPPAPPPPPPLPQDYYSAEQMPMDPPPPPPAPLKQAATQDNRVRKPFAGDPSFSKETVATAPVPQNPTVLAAAPADTTTIPKSLEPRPADASKPLEIPEPEPMATPAEAPVATASDKKPEDQPYPKLSDVPEKPAEFDKVKKAQAENIEEMKSVHDAAKQKSEALATEPSQTEPVKAKDAKPAPKKPAKPKAEPKKKSPPKKEEPVKEPEPAPAANPSEPKMSFPPGKYEEQLKQEQLLY